MEESLEARLYLLNIYLEQEQLERAQELLNQLPQAPVPPHHDLPTAAAFHRLGRHYERAERYPEARAAYDQALKRLTPSEDWQVYGVVLHDVADVLVEQKEVERALDLYRQAARAKEQGRNPYDGRITLLKLAEVSLALGRPEDAVSAALAAAHLLDHPPDGTKEDELRGQKAEYFRAGRILEAAEQYPDALAAYQQALARIDQRADVDEYVVVLLDVGDVHREMANAVEAQRAYEKVAEMEAAPIVARCSANERLTELLLETANPANPTDAGSVADRWLALLRSRGHEIDGEQVAVVWRHMGQALQALDRSQQAIEAYQSALSHINSEKDPHFYGVLLHDIGDVYLDDEQFQQAVTYFRNARTYKARGTNRRDLMVTLQALATTLLRVDQRDEAYQVGQDCLTEMQGLADSLEPRRQASVYSLVGQIQLVRHRPQEALTALEQARVLLDRDPAATEEDRRSLEVLLGVARLASVNGQPPEMPSVLSMGPREQEHPRPRWNESPPMAQPDKPSQMLDQSTQPPPTQVIHGPTPIPVDPVSPQLPANRHYYSGWQVVGIVFAVVILLIVVFLAGRFLH